MNGCNATVPGTVPEILIDRDGEVSIRPDLRALSSLAKELFQERRYDEARAACREILKRFPDDAAALKLLGRCRFDSKARDSGRSRASGPRAARQNPSA